MNYVLQPLNILEHYRINYEVDSTVFNTVTLQQLVNIFDQYKLDGD